MQFAIRVTVLECSFVKHSHGPLGVNIQHLKLEAKTNALNVVQLLFY
jgi:hypothetical protein